VREHHRSFTCPLLLACAVMASTSTKAQSSDDKPKLWASIADASTAEEGPSTPLWNRVKATIKSMGEENRKPFETLVKSNARLEMVSDLGRTPFTLDVVKAATESCVGPFLVGEGKAWLQFSWVCRTESPTSLSKFFTFKESPELAVTMWFEGNEVSELEATEPGPMPGARRVTMGAAEMMGSN
jgi:hypothetical protein